MSVACCSGTQQENTRWPPLSAFHRSGTEILEALSKVKWINYFRLIICWRRRKKPIGWRLFLRKSVFGKNNKTKQNVCANRLWCSASIANRRDTCYWEAQIILHVNASSTKWESKKKKNPKSILVLSVSTRCAYPCNVLENLLRLQFAENVTHLCVYSNVLLGLGECCCCCKA